MSTLSKSAELPEWLQAVVATCPRYADRRAIAAIINHHLYPISHRTLERWPVPTMRVNGNAVGETRA